MLEVDIKYKVEDNRILIYSDINYEEGFELVQKVLECIEIEKELPELSVIIQFRNIRYNIPISDEDYIRIENLMNRLRCNEQYIELQELEDMYNYAY